VAISVADELCNMGFRIHHCSGSSSSGRALWHGCQTHRAFGVYQARESGYQGQRVDVQRDRQFHDRRRCKNFDERGSQCFGHGQLCNSWTRDGNSIQYPCRGLES
jgi:hypothetical protein